MGLLYTEIGQQSSGVLLSKSRDACITSRLKRELLSGPRRTLTEVALPLLHPELRGLDLPADPRTPLELGHYLMDL